MDVPGWPYGYLGVDMFFVISGYLMAIRHSDISGLQDMKRFYLSRLARVAPAYYVAESKVQRRQQDSVHANHNEDCGSCE